MQNGCGDLFLEINIFKAVISPKFPNFWCMFFLKIGFLDERSTCWCSGLNVPFAVSRPGVHSPCQVIPKDFKKWYSQLPCLALST